MNKNYWKNKNINTLTEEDLEKLKIFIEEWSRVSQVMTEGQLNEFEFLDKAKKYLSDLFGISDNNLLTKLIDKITGKSSSG
jgi:hypothetical protein